MSLITQSREERVAERDDWLEQFRIEFLREARVLGEDGDQLFSILVLRTISEQPWRSIARCFQLHKNTVQRKYAAAATIAQQMGWQDL
ncbi:hypothetical protein [Thalassoroseus pseudoceratinae]|uniref:hypothetical protein n=1 Tax=Thalassoroseus pseudoceratinae TaxID=2713176 RepID=UPI00141EE25D|nr:hypothetical protein [Thalassoroseus pseudoceratinae]